MTETQTTRLVLGEPEARWFEIAPNLVEMKPSEAQRRLVESVEWPLGPEDKAAMMRRMERQGAVLDARYLLNAKSGNAKGDSRVGGTTEQLGYR